MAQKQMHDVESGVKTQPGFYYSALAQTILLGLIFLCIPGGGWNAFTSSGGAGVGDTKVLAVFNASFNWIFGACSLFAPAFVNRFGPRVALFIGGLGYPICMQVFLWAGKEHVFPGWFIPAFGVLFGFCAALLWTSGTGLLMSYPSPEKRGLYLGLWWAVFNIGGGICSFFIVFLKNFNSHESSQASFSTFIIFTIVTTTGCLLVMTLAPANKVTRSDGRPVVVPESPPVMDELKGMAELVFSWRSLALIPLMVYTNLCYGYQLNIFNAKPFDEPTAGLNSTFYWLAQCAASILLGLITDAEGVPQKTRAFRSIVFVGIIVGGSWLLGLYVNHDLHLNDCADTCKNLPEGIIRFGTPRWTLPAILFTIWGFSDSLAQCWCMWILGQFSENPITASRFAGLYKCFNSFGGAMGGVLIAANLSPGAQVWANTVLFFAGILLAGFVCAGLREDGRETLVNASS